MKGLGRVPSPPDERDYRMSDAIVRLEAEKMAPQRWHSDRVLDQGETMHCVGFAWAAWGIAMPVEQRWGNPMGHSIYAACKVIDGKPRDESGTHVRTGAKVMLQRKRIGNYFFAADVDEACEYISRFGPVVFGTLWTEAMCYPSWLNGIVEPRGKVMGGHAWLGIGIEPGRVIMRNSWGAKWGRYGDARIRIKDLRALFRYDGEACAASELPLWG